MRFETITIEKYGVFDTRSISFPVTPGLAVIYGPNEAGKSTCLEAVADFLFGIPNNSSRGQVFGYDQMRLAATLKLSTGSSLTLRRRKGRAGRTLSDGNGQAIEEVTLSKHLGSIDRERFAALFGLSHTSLRSGGERLLAADGDIGRLIVEAGGGLRSLVETIDGLAMDADKLFAPRKSADRQFYKALDAFETAEREARAGLLTREAYEEAQRRHNSAKANVDDLRRQHKDAGEITLRLQRLVRVIPSLRTLDATETELTAFVDLPRLQDGFTTTVREALRVHTTAEAGLLEAEGRQAALEAKIGGLLPSAAVLAAEAAIRDITEKAVHVQKERSDRPNRLKELTDGDAKLGAVRRSVGLPADADIKALLPPQTAIDHVQALAAQGLELRAKIETLSIQLESETSTLGELERRQAERREARKDQPLGITASDFSTLATLASDIDVKQKQVARLQTEIARRLNAIGFNGIEELRDWVCPDAAVVQTELERRASADAEIEKLEEKIITAIAKRDMAVAEIERLKKAGEVPSDEVIAGARHVRDDGWKEIRDRYLSEGGEAVSKRPASKRSADVATFQERTKGADDLADRKSFEATRVAALDVAERQRTEATATLVALTRQRATVLEKKAVSEQAWRDTWQAACARQDDPVRLKPLIEERRSILDRAEGMETEHSEIEQRRAEFDVQLSSLMQAETRLGLHGGRDKAPLGERITMASSGVKVHEDAYADFRHDETAVRDLKIRIQRTQASLDSQKITESSWRDAWTVAVRAIGLDDSAGPERANEVVTLWATAAGVLDGVRMTQNRLRRMDEDEAELRGLIDAVAQTMEFALPADEIAGAAMLNERLEAARKIAIERDSLTPQLNELAAERDAKKRAEEAARATITTLCLEVGRPREELAALAERQDQHHVVIERRRGLLETIESAGDGLPIEALRQQWSNRDLDSIQAELTEIQNQSIRLSVEIEAALADMQERARDLTAFSSAEGINKAVATREAAASEMHDAVQRYVEMTLAHELLSAAMDRIRTEQQDPLVIRAGELFAATTQQAFAGIATDVDDKGEPIVVGRRATGGMTSVATMSDGTRDQLFLAFRIASIEQYCAAAEPLPFIADDLLVHFDDDRGAATLELLAGLGKVTQVLLFTHHRHVVEAARGLADRGEAVLIDLAGA